jgi:hypothetical protein
MVLGEWARFLPRTASTGTNKWHVSVSAIQVPFGQFVPHIPFPELQYQLDFEKATPYMEWGPQLNMSELNFDNEKRRELYEVQPDSTIFTIGESLRASPDEEFL